MTPSQYDEVDTVGLRLVKFDFAAFLRSGACGFRILRYGYLDSRLGFPGS